MRLRTFLIVLLVALVNSALWVTGNLPEAPRSSKYPVQGLSYNPFQRDQSPFRNDQPTQEGIERDLEILAPMAKQLRLYSSTGLDFIPALAARHGKTLVASAWLGNDPEKNALEVEAAIRLAGRNRNVKRLLIGNETQLKNIVPLDELIGYLDEARRRLRTPVSTAEPWDYWIRYPELAQHVDFIAIHILPYWMEIPIEEAVPYVFEKFEAVRKQFPGRVIFLAETGWPSDGPQRGAAEATVTNQARFIREFLPEAEQRGILYNLIEAIDQPWKSALEGRAGEHFGILTADREAKFSITGPVLEDPNWELWMISSVIVGFFGMCAFLLRRPRIRLIGALFGTVVIQAAVSTAVQLAREASDQYMSPGDIVFWSVMLAAQSLLAIIFLSDAAEITDVIGRRPLRRKFDPAPPQSAEQYPFVSIHLACCKEPPEMVIATIESLIALDYPGFEIIVVDNNTPDESLWRPVEEYCKRFPERVRFFSLGRWPGFKAGALNFALRNTVPRATVIGVVDADYVVDSSWLRATTPYFLDPQVAVVQAPQEHRGWSSSYFEMMENDEYTGFFRIGMVQRNEENAIIQHGTMTLIRRGDLDTGGGWSEWCICEDAELGLRLLIAGRSTVYIDKPLGYGLVPDSYEAYKKQRFRWAYGGMRILRRYWRELLGFRQGLTASQRYQFVKGWLPWVGDALHLAFTGAALVWSALLLIYPLETDFPEPIFIYPALALVALRLIGTAWTYHVRVKIGPARTLLAMVAGGSLTHTIGKAVVQGLFFLSHKPFYRTPKLERAPKLVQALISVWQEALLALLLVMSSVGILIVFGIVNDTAILWAIALLTQSLPYLSAIAAAFMSAHDAPPPPQLLRYKPDLTTTSTRSIEVAREPIVTIPPSLDTPR